MPNLTGQTLGRYQLLEPLGEGGMAVVYKAFDTRLECEVAVKIIRLENLPRNSEERALKRFEREAKSVARLTHSSIVKVTDYGEYEGSPYLVMEYLPGGTLKELFKQLGSIPWREAAQLLMPIAEALGYAHSQGIIHRDIKPSNILLTESGQPMLTDFGVAKIIEDEATQDLTGTSATVGTPEYMAPEQITSKTVDARADLYSLGVVFYEMVTGRKPFQADTPMAVLVMHAHDPLPRPSQFVKNLPENVEHFLLKALIKKPEDRYQSAEEMAKILQGLISGSRSVLIPQIERFFNPRKRSSPRDKKVNKAITQIGLISLVIILLLGIGITLGLLLNNQKNITFIGTLTRTSEPLTLLSPESFITIEPTETETSIITPTLTSTPEDQYFGQFIKNSNCRVGPGPHYTNIQSLIIGVDVKILGFNPDSSWVNIKIDDTQIQSGMIFDNCWVDRSNIALKNDTLTNPIFTPVPLQISYQVIQLETITYPGGEYPKSSETYTYGGYRTENEATAQGTKSCNRYFDCSPNCTFTCTFRVVPVYHEIFN